MLKRRAHGEAAGWRIARLPEPVVTARGVLLADFRLTQGDRKVYVVLGEEVKGEWDAPVLAVPVGRKAVCAADVLTRADRSDQQSVHPAGAGRAGRAA